MERAGMGQGHGDNIEIIILLNFIKNNFHISISIDKEKRLSKVLENIIKNS